MAGFFAFAWTILCGWALFRFVMAIGQDDDFVNHWGRMHRAFVVLAITIVQILGWLMVLYAFIEHWDDVKWALLKPETLWGIAPVGIAYYLAEHIRRLTIETRDPTRWPRFIQSLKDEYPGASLPKDEGDK